MRLLNGVADPPGKGIVVEVHLDIMEAPAVFLERMTELGFEDDPFLNFYPPEYRFHYTGRTRALPSDLRKVLPPIRALVAQVLQDAREAGVRMYIESELVRDMRHFDAGDVRGLTALEGFAIKPGREGLTSKADVHVEFQSGTVPEDVRSLLGSKQFYWVRTPASKRFPSEEIATLQPSTFAGARLIYDRLLANPLPACTGIHLEQKLDMVCTHENLPLPAVMDVISLRD